MLTPDESRDLARRMHNLGANLSPEERRAVTSAASTQGYEAALELLPAIGNRGDQQLVTIETAAWIMGEFAVGAITLEVALQTLRSAAEQGL